jgi:hypothetical protein
MNENVNEVCAICHEATKADDYTIPECNHTYHTNCIITWFRMGKNTCPLCNNMGINSLKQMDDNTTWAQKQRAFENYKKLRAMSRKKNAPTELKNMVKKLKKLENKKKESVKEKKIFKENKHPDLTGIQIFRHIIKLRGKIWSLERSIRRHKQLIGFQQNITNIILPIKMGV